MTHLHEDAGDDVMERLDSATALSLLLISPDTIPPAGPGWTMRQDGWVLLENGTAIPVPKAVRMAASSADPTWGVRYAGKAFSVLVDPEGVVRVHALVADLGICVPASGEFMMTPVDDELMARGLFRPSEILWEAWDRIEGAELRLTMAAMSGTFPETSRTLTGSELEDRIRWVANDVLDFIENSRAYRPLSKRDLLRVLSVVNHEVSTEWD